jgi:2,3-bisphosphoglycerate-independent phosphoglycerate mutase
MLYDSLTTDRPRPVVLCILDGWGSRAKSADNAIAMARTPNWDRLLTTELNSLLLTAGPDVGLPAGQMGNSETGHMNLGAGQVVTQELPRIDRAMRDGTLADKPALKILAHRLRTTEGRCHLMGLVSPGGVHSHQDHIVALARIMASRGVPVTIHAFLDGRDTPPRSAPQFMAAFLEEISDLQDVKIGTVMGRFYPMGRDKRWNRVEKAYQALMDAEGERAPDPLSAIEQSHAKGVTDEFVLPTIIGDYKGMFRGDGLLMANFRNDRVREILLALTAPEFNAFERPDRVHFVAKAGMIEYSTELNDFFTPLFPPSVTNANLGYVLSEAGMTQMRIAETEKYPHVTFFFNGGRENRYWGEERILVPSPKVATYDLAPEMSAFQVTDRLIEAIEWGQFDIVVVNYANGDMVGHTGRLKAAISAAGAIDVCLGRLETVVRQQGGVMLITADHGNCEMMRDPETGEPHTAHTMNPVPAVLINAPPWAKNLCDGRLADVAPTLLRLLDLPRPAEMTGHSLIEEDT